MKAISVKKIRPISTMMTMWNILASSLIFISTAHPLNPAQNVTMSAAILPVASPQPQGRQCLALASNDLCSGSSWTHGVTLPNLYGHYTVDQALAQLGTTLAEDLPPGSSSSSSDLVLHFLCALYLPPCPQLENRTEGVSLQDPSLPLPLPCRPLCEMAREEVISGVGGGGGGRDGGGGGGGGGLQAAVKSGGGWPASIRCHMFPTDRCYMPASPGEVKYVIKALVASGTGANRRDVNPESVASLDSELGDGDTYDVQVIALGANQIPPRRYDLNDLGDPAFFQGWADVQGTGAANDYCRVIGRGKRRFLSCALAGTRGQGHHYVSRLGFDPGYAGTWFMRDVDSDGRDDYCRCTGAESSSRVVCMKAGEKGFYGTTFQGGSQYTFELSGRRDCHTKPLNPHFGR